MTPTHDTSSKTSTDRVDPFADTADDVPYSGECTPVENRDTVYGGELVELGLEVDDRVAVWVAGHWLVGTVSHTSFQSPNEHQFGRGKCSVGITLDSTHRDVHDDLPTGRLLLVTSTDDDYTLGPDGWKTVDASVAHPRESALQRTLLGVCGGVERLPSVDE